MGIFEKNKEVLETQRFKLSETLTVVSQPFVLINYSFKSSVVVWVNDNKILTRLNKPIDKFRRELDVRMEKAFGNVHKVSKKYSVDLRTAAFIVSVERVAQAFEMRGSLV